MTDDRPTVELLALCKIAHGTGWNFLAREAQRPGGLQHLLAGAPSERGPDASEWPSLLEQHAERLDDYRDQIQALIRETAAEGISLTTVLDDDYPVNLRTVYDRPPFLFYRGSLSPDDALSVAVVGTRQPSVEGIDTAKRIASSLVAEGITVLSGLARGIDTAAHTATLEAGGRTIAVMGTGIRQLYPPENAALADRILASGALVSQFWPDSPPRRDTFPRRNAVMSGMSQGTVVVEATATSGAKMQARLANLQGKRVFLMADLVRGMPWARRYVDRGAIEVRAVDDIVRLLQTPAAIEARSSERLQLSLTLV